MNWLEFVTKILSAIAWPATVLILAYALRDQLQALLPLLTKVKIRDLEFEFGRQVAELAAEAATQLPAISSGGRESSYATDMSALILASPRTIILEAWLAVDRAARTAIARNKVMQPIQPNVSLMKVAKALQSAGILDPAQMSVFSELHSLRNQAVHMPDLALSRTAVNGYVMAADQLRNFLDAAQIAR